jgi:hypothetical protein
MILDVESVDLLLSTQRWVGSSDALCGCPLCVSLDTSVHELTGRTPGIATGLVKKRSDTVWNAIIFLRML